MPTICVVPRMLRQPKGTIEQQIAALSGRLTGQEASGAELMSKLTGKGGARLATELRSQLSPDALNELKVAVWRRASEAGENMIPWQAQRSSQEIAKFLNTPLASALYSPNELAMFRAVQQAHEKLIPVPRTVNTSGTFYRLNKALGDMKKQTFQVMLGIHGGLPGYLGLARRLIMVWARRSIASAQRRQRDYSGGRSRGFQLFALRRL